MVWLLSPFSIFDLFQCDWRISIAVFHKLELVNSNIGCVSFPLEKYPIVSVAMHWCAVPLIRDNDPLFCVNNTLCFLVEESIVPVSGGCVCVLHLDVPLFSKKKYVEMPMIRQCFC